MTTRMLVEDFLQGGFPRGTQLINGEVVMHDPTLLHQRAVSRIHLALGIWTMADPQRGEAGLGGNWRFGPATSLIPDVWWVRPDISAQLVHHRSTPACPVFDESYEIAEGQLTSRHRDTSQTSPRSAPNTATGWAQPSGCR